MRVGHGQPPRPDLRCRLLCAGDLAFRLQHGLDHPIKNRGTDYGVTALDIISLLDGLVLN